MTHMHTHSEEQIFGHVLTPAPALGPYRLVPSPAAEPGYPAIYVMHATENLSILVQGEANARRVAAGLRMLELVVADAKSGERHVAESFEAVTFAGFDVTRRPVEPGEEPMAADMDLPELEMALVDGLAVLFTVGAESDEDNDALDRLHRAVEQVQPPSTVARMAANSAAAVLLAFEHGYQLNDQGVDETTPEPASPAWSLT